MKNWARLFAFLLTDGGVTVRNFNRGIIFFHNRSERLRYDFAESIAMTFGLRTSDDGFTCRAFSFEATKRLLQYSQTFRKKPYAHGTTKVYPEVRILKEIMEADEEILREFMRYAFSCDGSVHLSIRRSKNQWRFQKRVQLKCSHPILLNQYHQLLMRLNISSRIERADKRLIIDSREGLMRFADLIGFVDGVKISGKGGSKWRGLEKKTAPQHL